MKVKPIEEVVEFLKPIADELGVEIVEGRWDRRGNALCLLLDAEGGVDLNLCERFHRAIDGPLDEFDPTFGAAYNLTCSSAGLDRPFKTDRDFERRLHEQVEAHLYAPVGGKKEFVGELRSFDKDEVVLLTKEGEVVLPREKIAKICLFIDI